MCIISRLIDNKKSQDNIPNKSTLLQYRKENYTNAFIQDIQDLIKKYTIEDLKHHKQYEVIFSVKWNNNKLTPESDFMKKLWKMIQQITHQHQLQTNQHRHYNRLDLNHLTNNSQTTTPQYVNQTKDDKKLNPYHQQNQQKLSNQQKQQKQRNQQKSQDNDLNREQDIETNIQQKQINNKLIDNDLHDNDLYDNDLHRQKINSIHLDGIGEKFSGITRKKIFNYISQLQNQQNIVVITQDVKLINLLMSAKQQIYIVENHIKTSLININILKKFITSYILEQSTILSEIQSKGLSHQDQSNKKQVVKSALQSNQSNQSNQSKGLSHQDQPKQGNQAKFQWMRDQKQKVINDIIVLQSILDNEFIPSFHSIYIHQNPTIILDIYIKVLDHFRQNNINIHLINSSNNILNCEINKRFFDMILYYLMEQENDFIQLNKYYTKYQYFYKLRKLFPQVSTFSIKTLKSDIKQFDIKYNQFKQKVIKSTTKSTTKLMRSDNIDYHVTDKINITNIVSNKVLRIIQQSMCIGIPLDQIVSFYQNYYKTKGIFPSLMWSFEQKLKQQKLTDQDNYHLMSKYDKLLFKLYNSKSPFDKVIQDGDILINPDQLQSYYSKYLYQDYSDKNIQTICYNYLDGLVQSFNYYFNQSNSYDQYYYRYVRAPLIKDLVEFNRSISTLSIFNKKLHLFTISPIQQLLYVTPNNKLHEIVDINKYKSFESIIAELIRINIVISYKKYLKIFEQILQKSKSSNRSIRLIDKQNINTLNNAILLFLTTPSLEEDLIFIRYILNKR